MCKCEVDRGLWIIDRMYEHTIGLYSLSRLEFCDESFQSRSGGYFWEYVDQRNASEAVEKLLWFRKSELVRRNLGRRVFDLRERFVSKLERWLTSGRGVVFLMAGDGGRRGRSREDWLLFISFHFSFIYIRLVEHQYFFCSSFCNCQERKTVTDRVKCIWQFVDFAILG